MSAQAAQSTPPRVIVTKHALERARERFGMVMSERMVQDEVRDALLDGRVSCTQPRFLVRHPWLHREKIGRHKRGKYRFAVPPGAKHAYVLRHMKGGDRWLVVTVLTPL